MPEVGIALLCVDPLPLALPGLILASTATNEPTWTVPMGTGATPLALGVVLRVDLVPTLTSVGRWPCLISSALIIGSSQVRVVY